MINFQNTVFVTSYGVSAQFGACDIPEVAFCGRSNVGKSSLLNKLCNRKDLARVSSKPGKTTTINLFSLDRKFNLCDLPGYGFARRTDEEKLRWADLMEGYFSCGRNLKVALLLLDCRHDPSADDIDMIKYFNSTGLPFVCVLTKTDKLNKTEYAERTEILKAACRSRGARDVIPFSINNMDDVKNLQNILSQYLEKS